MSATRNAILAIGLLFSWALTFNSLAQDQPPESEVESQQRVDVDAKEETAEAKRKLETFFEEMEGLLDAKDKFGEAAEKIRRVLTTEFQENEGLLREAAVASQADEVAAFENRQKVIAQYVIELNNRSMTVDPSQHFELRRKIQSRFREFRRANPELAKQEKFQQKERDLSNQAMQRMRGFMPGRGGQQATIAETMRSLSAGGTKPTTKPLVNAAHPGERAGAIQQLRSRLQNLLKLKWKGEQLALDRDHWNAAFAGKTADDIRIDVDHLLKQRGVAPSRELDERRRALLRARMANGMQNSNVERLFHELRGSSNGSFSRSAAGNSVNVSFNNGSVQARMKSSPQQFELVIEELASPSRVLRFVDSQESGLQIMLIGELVHRCLQKPSPDTSMSVLEVLDDEVITLKAQSFAQLYREHPRFVEDRFFALLDHLGIIPPASRFDERIVNRFVENLAADKDHLRHEVDRMVHDLDADQFTKRDAAYEELQAGLDDYCVLLYAKQTDESLSREVRARIKRLLGLRQAKGVSHLDAVIAALGLEQDRSYLEEVRELVDQPAQLIIDQRLRQLTAPPR